MHAAESKPELPIRRRAYISPIASTAPVPRPLNSYSNTQTPTKVDGYVLPRQNTSNASPQTYSRGPPPTISHNLLIDEYDDSEDLHGIKKSPESEKMLIYRSYAREVNGEEFEALVRGYVYYTALNRKGKLMIAAVEKLVGLPPKEEEKETEHGWLPFRRKTSTSTLASVSSSNASLNSLESQKDNSSLAINAVLSAIEPISQNPVSPARTPPPSSPKRLAHAQTEPILGIPARKSEVKHELKATIRERLTAIAHKSAAMRDVQVVVESKPDKTGHQRRRTFWTSTDESGRFVKTCRVPFLPQSVHVTCGNANETSTLQFAPTNGISVISDIDDTIRHTGVTKGKRELLQNVFAKSFQDCKLDGVSEWYNQLAREGAHFHYVSNSPWQLYDVIYGFLKHNQFPEGSIHLKRYAGVFDELTEPAKFRKKARLEQIVRHFPGHKFILVGDSGEADLESYADLARTFPDKIAAIYIRSIEDDLCMEPISPPTKNHDETRTAVVPMASPITPPPLPSRNRATFDLEDSISRPQSPEPPRLPTRPKLLRRTSSKIMEGLTTVKSAARLFPHSEPVRRKSQPNLHLEDDLFVNSSQEFDFDRIDHTANKRADLWKLRVQKQRRLLPHSLEIKTWRTPDDIEKDSIDLLKRLRVSSDESK